MNFYQKYIKLNEPRDFLGLKFDISLDDDEWYAEKLTFNNSNHDNRFHAFSVIKMNSKYLDLVDHTYCNKGLGNYYIFFFILLFFVVTCDLVFFRFDIIEDLNFKINYYFFSCFLF